MTDGRECRIGSLEKKDESRKVTGIRNTREKYGDELVRKR